MKPFRCLACVLLLSMFLLAEAPSAATALPRLKISDNKRFIVREDGAPFFYLADTAWELFHRLNREEADEYLLNRAAKGFNVIYAVVLAEYDLATPNAYGHLPLTNNDPAKPVEAYFQHVDYIVDKAESLGLYVGMLPTWGDKWNKKWGADPEIFTPANAEAYGEWLGKRYKDKPIIWILGGDRPVENEKHFAIVRALARGLKRGDGGSHLMTFHPPGRQNSSKWFHNDDWLDFNIFQSGHREYNGANYEYNLANRLLAPPKPTLDGEPRYEDHPVRGSKEQDWFDDYDTRQAAYWSLLSGACGHTYGNHNIWQFLDPARHKPVTLARTPWRTAMDQSGATQMKHLRALFESRPWHLLAPDQSVIANDPGTGGDHQRAARASDGSFAFIYTPTGRPVTARLDKISAEKVRALWFDPRAGLALVMGEFESKGTQVFEPFSRGRGNDWVLILEDSARNYPVVGATKNWEWLRPKRPVVQ